MLGETSYQGRADGAGDADVTAIDQGLGWVPEPGREVTGMTILRGRTLRRPWGRRSRGADHIDIPGVSAPADLSPPVDEEPPGLDPDDDGYLDYVAPPRRYLPPAAEAAALGDDGPVADAASGSSSWRSLSRTTGPDGPEHDEASLDALPVAALPHDALPHDALAYDALPHDAPVDGDAHALRPAPSTNTSFAPVTEGPMYSAPAFSRPAGHTPFVSSDELSRPGSGATYATVVPPAPPRGVGGDATMETTALRDEITLATATLQTLIQTHRAELAGLISEVALLSGTVADMRHELESREPKAPVDLPSAAAVTGPVAESAAPPLRDATTAASVTPTAPTATQSTAGQPAAKQPAAAKQATARRPATKQATTRQRVTEEPATQQPARRSAVAAPPSALAARIAQLEVQAAAAVSAAGARIGLPAGHVDVLQRWVANDGKGVIEVAHPGGRHRVGLAAVVYAVASGRQVLVVVPTLDSAASWRASLNAHAGELEVLVDEGRRRDPSAPPPNVVISTAATTARRITAGFSPTAMLVAVDAERFGTALLAKALDDRCEWRLGLSEAYRSNTRGLARYADAYFGGTVLTIA